MKSVKLFIIAAIYVAALLWAYADVVSPGFAYDGFTLQWPGAGTMVWVITLALVPVLVLPYELSRPSVLIVWWLYLSTYVPSILVPAISLGLTFEKLLPLQLCLLVCMGVLCFVSSARPLAITRIAVSPALFWIAFLMIWVAGLAVVCVYGRVSMLIANLESIIGGGSEYDIRGEFSGAIAEFGRFLGYTCGQLAQALNPYLMVFGIVNRKKICLIAGILGQIVIFGLVGIKSALFSAIFLPLLFVCMKNWRRSFGVALTTGLATAILFSAVVDRFTDNVLLSSLITRRTLATPGLLTGFYFEHYSQVPHAGIAYHFSHDGSTLGPPNEIGLAYFGNANIDANANLWAEGFADFGLSGVAGFTLLVAFLIWIYDSIAVAHGLELAVLLAAMPALMFSNTTPTTVLFTHGGLTAALLLYFAPLTRRNSETELGYESVAAESFSSVHPKAPAIAVSGASHSQHDGLPEITLADLAVRPLQDSGYGNLGNLSY